MDYVFTLPQQFFYLVCFWFSMCRLFVALVDLWNDTENIKNDFSLIH